jgi:hypothetical protein
MGSLAREWFMVGLLSAVLMLPTTVRAQTIKHLGTHALGGLDMQKKGQKTKEELKAIILRDLEMEVSVVSQEDDLDWAATVIASPGAAAEQQRRLDAELPNLRAQYKLKREEG